MKRIISYILAAIVGLLLSGLLFPITCSGQSPALLSFGAGSSVPAKIYDPLPPRVVFTGDSTSIVAATVGSAVSSAEMGGNIFGYVEANFTNTLRAQSLEGTESAPYVFRSPYGNSYSRVGSGANGANVFGQTGSPVSDWVHFNGMIGYGNGVGVTSSTGIKWEGKAGGSNLIATDLILVHPASPGIQYNGDGDAGTYGKMYFKGVRIFGDPTETTEGFYGGDTSTPPTNHGIVANTYVEDMFITQTTWDMFQANSTDTLEVRNLTAYLGGLANESGQKSLFQGQNIGSKYLGWSLLWDAPRMFQIASRSATIEHNVWYSSEAGFYQGLYDDAGYTTHLTPQDTVVYFNSNEIYSKVARTYGVTVSEDSTLFIFINNIVDADSITTFIQDSRGTPVYPLYEINTKRQSRPTDPVFNSLDSSYKDHGLITTNYYYDKGYGYRVPEIVPPEPTITSFTPVSGAVGDSIDIIGDRFTGLDSIFFESTKATGLRLIDDETIRVAVPSGATSGIIIVYTDVDGEVWAAAKHGFTVESGFNPFTDISWVAAFSADEYNTGTNTWPNNGSGNDATQSSAPAAPAKGANGSMVSGQSLTFNSTTDTGLAYGSGTVNEPFETWIEIVTPSSFPGTQRIYANGSATRLSISSAGALSVAGTSDVSTGVTLSTNTYYVIRVVNNGAGSSITVNNGTPATFSITAQNGSSTPKIGSAYTQTSGNWNGQMGSFFQKSGLLSSGEITDMWNYFGF